ncbi:hypothetical protein Mal64_28040 [Pseudobythopirellula maris]|uniref:Uncharacterized protein n=1 Tax=Pseudobythopirellula maris TaxID=2527991 RepID=A0A5C5ZJ41_9BACT|nr:hypothetical protein [Pseudobythopirellula maris]TWT87266.1 hypothetical protein Mal64_28040 [Pseudobythopirellula maris]
MKSTNPTAAMAATLCAAMLCVATIGVIAASDAQAAPNRPPTGGLGDSLLGGDLGGLLAPTAPPAGAKDRPLAPTPDWIAVPDSDTLERMRRPGAAGAQLPQGPGAGEDLGESPLDKIVGGMKEAEQRLADRDTGTVALTAQKQVVADLEALIAKMEQQCQSCQNPSQSKKEQGKKQASQRSKPGAPKPGAGKPAGSTTAQSAARSSTTRMGSAPAGGAAGKPMPEALKQAWGHLPERVREQMLQSGSEDFLPEYREEIQKYFQRLAEEEAAP